jgi:hypothetical protein
MEAANASETAVHFYQTTRRNNPYDSHFHARRHENLKCHKSQSAMKRDTEPGGIRDCHKETTNIWNNKQSASDIMEPQMKVTARDWRINAMWSS